MLGRGPEAHKRPRKGPEGQKRLGRGPRNPQKPEKESPQKGQKRGKRPRSPQKKAQKRPRGQKRLERRPAHKRPRKGPEARSANNLRRGEAGKSISNPVLMHKQKKPETQPLRKAPQPTGKKLVWDKLKPETFGQNFRSKLSVKTQGPKPYTISTMCRIALSGSTASSSTSTDSSWRNTTGKPSLPCT